jgi:hypothetical protein
LTTHSETRTRYRPGYSFLRVAETEINLGHLKIIAEYGQQRLDIRSLVRMRAKDFRIVEQYVEDRLGLLVGQPGRRCAPRLPSAMPGIGRRRRFIVSCAPSARPAWAGPTASWANNAKGSTYCASFLDMEISPQSRCRVELSASCNQNQLWICQ